jgi:anthranilate phosphoribosyltransferase
MIVAPLTSPTVPHTLLNSLLAGRPLSEADSESLFESLLAGAFSDDQIAAILTAIQSRGVTVDELVGAARVMRRHVTRVPAPAAPDTIVIDTCGTGGSPKTFNISTAVALVVAAASPHREPGSEPALRILVAKHGNRSRSGRGSAEVLQRLGVNVDAPPSVQSRCLDLAGVCFCFAIHHHPAAKVAALARRAIGTPTIFNLLGPLTNPAAAPRQLIGTYSRIFVDKLAHALARLGSQRAMVVHGSDGMDELTTTGPSLIAHVESGSVRTEHFDPASLNLPRARPEDLTARDLDHAAQIIRDVLSGHPGPARDIVLLNAAAALTIAGAEPDLVSALRTAAIALDSGRAQTVLNDLVTLSQAAIAP